MKLTIEAIDDYCDTLILKDHAFEIRPIFLFDQKLIFRLVISNDEIYADTVLFTVHGFIASKLFLHNTPRRI